MRSIIGHRNPDTDTICSAIAHEAFLTARNVEAKAFALGNVNNETKFVLERFGVEAPPVISELPHNSEIILVDHNEEGQSIKNLNDLDIVEIIDHHKVTLQTDKPIRIHVEPLGSSCSIIAKKFFAKGIDVPQKIAQILVAGIMSDTLAFRSPTTTKTDKELVGKLNEIAQIEDIEAFSMEMFDAKSDVKELSTEEIVKLDYKQFDFAGNKYGVGVMETTNKDFGLERKEEILEYLKKIKESENMDAVYFSIIDILNGESYTLCSGESEKKLFVELFDAKEEQDVLYVKNLVSRKKEITPVFEKHFNQ